MKEGSPAAHPYIRRTQHNPQIDRCHDVTIARKPTAHAEEFSHATKTVQPLQVKIVCLSSTPSHIASNKCTINALWRWSWYHATSKLLIGVRVQPNPVAPHGTRDILIIHSPNGRQFTKEIYYGPLHIFHYTWRLLVGGYIVNKKWNCD